MGDDLGICANCHHSAGHHRLYRKSCSFQNSCECQKFVTPAPSPARDDAETVCWCGHAHTNGPACPKYGCACVLHAPFDLVAAPDELTALPEMVRLETAEKYRAELDALRERIRALADEWEDLDHKDHCWDCDRGSDLRKLLGDA